MYLFPCMKAMYIYRWATSGWGYVRVVFSSGLRSWIREYRLL